MKNLLKNRFVANTNWVVLQQICQLILSLFVGVFTARYLGPSNYGIINYAASFLSLFTSVCSLGMDSVIIKNMIDEPEREGELLGSCIVFRVISGILSSISAAVFVIILNPGETETIIVCAIYSLSLILKAPEILGCWFQRYLKSKYVSIARTIAYILVSAYKIFLLVTQQSLIWFAFSILLEHFLLSGVEVVFYFKLNAQKLSVNFRTGFDVLKNSYHFILSGLMVAIYGHMDKLMLKEMIDTTSVGLYSIASAICTMWIFVPTAIIGSARPIIMEYKKSGNNDMYYYRLKQLYSAVIWLCVFVSAIISIFGSLAIDILYGEAYLDAAPTLKILIWSEVFSMIGTARGVWVVSEGKQKYVKYYLFYGVVVNLVLNWILIPKMGIAGAALATLVTQITTSLIAPLFYRETRIHTKYVFESFLFTWYFRRKEMKK